MATMTIAQALASTATGITIADTPANIGAALSNVSLVARIGQFTLSGNGAAWASLATQFAGLGSKFSKNGFRLVVRDSVAFLNDPANAAGLAIGTTIAVFDTADNLLTIAGTPLAARAGSVLMSRSASLTLAQLRTLEGEPSFSVLPGQSITLADSAANLLALRGSENRPSIKAFSVAVSSVASLSAAVNLVALPHFSVASGVTLTVSDTVATMTDPSVAGVLAGLAATQGVALTIADSLTALLANAGAIATLATTIPGLTTLMTDFEFLTAAQLTAAATLPHFGIAPGGGVLLSDTAAHLLALAPALAALATVTNLSQSATVDAAQLAGLLALPNFDRAGRGLTVTDTIGGIASLTPDKAAAASAVVVQDTVAHLLAASGLPPSATSAVALLDGDIYTVAQATGLLNLGLPLTLVAFGGATALLISDTTQHLIAAGSVLSALEADGPVIVTATDGGPLPGSVLTAAQAASLVTSAAGIPVSDTGAALTAFAGQIFGRGFSSITVTSGVFAGTQAQLLDIALHFGGPTSAPPTLGAFVRLTQSVSASAQLVGDTTTSVAHLTAMSLLPGFSLGSGATLTMSDTIGALAGASGLVSAFATSVQATDSETVTAANAAALASIRSAVGSGHFSLNGNVVTVSDDAANIANPANAAGVALAGAVTLSVPSIATAVQAAFLLALGSTFSPNGMGLTIADTAAHLAALTGSAATLNGWRAQVLLSADATLTVAGAQALLGFTGFAVGTHGLTLADTAANLVASGAAATEAVASTVVLSQPATLSVADANTVLGLHGFSANSQAVTIADTPANLAAMTPAERALATTETILARTVVNAADFTIAAAQLAALQGMPHLSLSGFTNTIAVSDTATALAALAPAFSLAASGSLLTHIVPVLSGDATATAALATTLAHLPGFGLGGHALTVRDTPANLVSPAAAAGLTVATSVGIDAPDAVSVPIANALAVLPGFAADTNPLTIADTPVALLSLSPSVAALAAYERIVPYSELNAAGFVLTAAQLQTLAAIPNLAIAGPIAISDTAANLVLLEAVFAAAAPGSKLLAVRSASTAVLSADATVSAASLQALSALPAFGLAGHTLTVSDTAANLLASTSLALASSASLSADATVNAFQAEALHAVAGFSLGGHQLTIADIVSGLANMDPGTIALASAIQLLGNGVASVAQLHALQALPNFSLNGHALIASDTAPNLLTLAGANTALASAIYLQGNASVTADQAEALATLPNFNARGSQVLISDSVANLLHVSGSALLPDDWAGELIATTIALTGNATVTAAQAEELSALGGRLVLGGFSLTVSDSAANLLNPADAAGLALASRATLSGPEAGLTAAAATALAGVANFSKGGNSVTVSDTAANLAFAGNAAGIALADHVVRLSAPASLSVVSAKGLIGQASFQSSGAAPVTIADTLTHLLQLGGVSLPHNDAVLRAASIGLSEDATATVAQMAALAALPEYAHFSLNGFSLVVSDSGRHLAAYTPDTVAVPASIAMVGDAALTAAQANHLAALGANLGDNTLTVRDTPAALLDPANTAGVALAGALAVAGNATVTAAQAVSLFGNPLFSTGGHALTIQDSTAALLGLNSTIDTEATTLALAGNETVSVAALLGLAQLGIKFSTAGHTLRVADTASNLLTLNTLETHLAPHEELSASASVTAAAAEILAGLPHFALGTGVTLTIVDNVANLTALSGAAQAISTGERLAPGSIVTLTVAQAQGLSALGGFSSAGATIVVNDTIAHLALTGWPTVATRYNVTDSIATLVANASTVLLTHAASVILAGDSVIDTTTIDSLAGIANFTRGSAALVVADSADAIGAHAATILAIASAARVISSGAVTAAEAEALITLANAGKLTFAGSSHLGVTDRFANLSNAALADGVALATVITVTDTEANLVAATAHDWGAITPFYVLTADGTVTGADARVLVGLGGHYSNGGFVLTMSDTAAAVVASAATRVALGIHATVSDSVGNIEASIAGLLSLGGGLTSVTTTDTSPVSASAAAGLQVFASVLAGSPVAVSDSAAAVTAASAGLLGLGTHLGSVTLTDASPISVAVATGLLPLLSHLAGGTVIDVSDTGANIAAQANGLASLGTDLGTVTLSDGTTTDAVTAAALLPVQAYLGAATLTVTDTAAAIVAASVGLTTLEGDIRIDSISALDETVAHVLTYGSALTALNATATISDTAAHVNAALDGLQALNAVVTAVSLTDGGTPTLHVTVAQLADDSDILAGITSPHDVAVHDTAAHIQADLTGGTSAILGALADLSGIVATDAGTLTLTSPEILAAGVDDGAGSALEQFSGGTFVVTGVAAADAGTIAALGVPPASMSISDTAAGIQADLASGSSELVANRALISAISVRGGGVISLTEAQATAAHVDDGAGSVFARLAGADLAVTSVSVAQIAAVAALPVAPTAIGVSDTAAHVQADLIAGSSHILSHIDAISAIEVTDAGTISLTVAQIEASGVDDGPGSALANTYGETLVVTGATVTDIDTLANLDVPPDGIAIVDTAAHIQADLSAGGFSFILAHLDLVSGIAVTPSGTITLSESQVLHAGVDDGAGSALSLMTGETLVVTDVAVADIGTILGLDVAPASIAVDGTAAEIEADLASGTSALVANIGAIAAITVGDSGIVTLTTAQIEAAGVDDGTGSVLAKLSGGSIAVTDAAISDIATLLGLGVPPASIGISDTAANLDADLTSGASAILAYIGHIGSIALTDAATPALALTLAQLTVASPAIGHIATPYTLAMSDTAAHIQANLASGSSELLAHLGATSGITVSDGGGIALTQAQVLGAHVDDGAGSVFSLLSGGTLEVTDVSVADIGAVLGLGFAPSSIVVSDTAAAVQADLASGASAILGNLGSIRGIGVNDAGTIELTDAQIQAAGVDDGAGSALAKTSGATIAVTGVPVADIATILGLGVPPGSVAVSDTAANIQADLASGVSRLVADRAHISSIAVSDSGTISLTVTQALATYVDDGATSVLGKTTGGTLTVTDAALTDLPALGALYVPPTGLAISDTAANLQADLTSGASVLAANLALIGGIAVSDAGTITLTETQLLAAHVDDGAGSVLALTSGGSLAVTHVLAADILIVGALSVVPDTFAIDDTAAHIQADLTSDSSAILSYLGAIASIAVSPTGTIALTEAQVLGVFIDDGAGSALSKMSGLTLHVSDVAIADIGTILGLGVPPASIAVSDTATDIQADLTGGSSAILANLSSIGGITVSDDGEIDMTVAQIEAAQVDDGSGSVFDKISGGSLAVTGALVSDIETLSGLSGRPNVVGVSDTAAHIQADLIAGGASHILAHPGLIGVITVSDAGTIVLTETQIRASGVDDGIHAALVKTTGGSLTVTEVLAADVGIVAALGAAPTSISVSDTAAHIQADLTSDSSNILAHIGVIGGIAVSPAGTIALTETQIMAAHVDDGAGSALALMTGQTLNVTEVLVADVGTIAALGVPPDHILVTDTAAHIQADLVSGSSNILANLGAITGITLDPAGTISLTDAQVQVAGIDDGAGSALAKMTGETLVVTGVPVADIGTIVGLGVAPSLITVEDTDANLIADLIGGSSVIAANSGAISSVTPTDATLSVANATALYNALLGVASLNESGLTITGTASALLTAETNVPAMLSAVANVTMTDNPTGLTAAQATTLSGILGGILADGQTMQVVDTAAYLTAAGNTAGIALATDVELDTGILADAALATTLAGLHAFNAGAQAIWIQDTVADLLDTGNAAGLAIAMRVFPSSDVTVNAAQLASLSAIAHFETNSHAIAVTGNAADIAALSQAALGFSSLAAVSDTSAQVSASLDALQSAVTGHSHALSIALTDGVPNTVSIAVTAATYSADRPVIDSIATNGAVLVNGTATQLSALSSTLAADAVVGQVAVTDTAANILSNLSALNAIGAKFDSASITDTTLSATLVSSLLTIPNLHAGSVTIVDTGTQIAAAMQSSGALGLAFMSAHTVQLSADSVVTASQALSLESLTSLQKNSHTLSAWDTASHLIDSVDGYLAAVSAAIIDGVYLKTVSGTATVSAATAAALFSIPNFSKNNPDASSNVLTVQDTAAHLESAFAGLNAHKAAVSGIVVSASSTVTDAVFGHLLTLGAMGALGVNLTVRDTAANLIANTPAQLAGTPSLTPTTWALSGSATVTVAGAALLGGLSGFSAGAFTLTLGADASASVADANNVGHLGATLHLGGHRMHVAGSVASVSGLSSAAKAIATPDITDTFANIAGLTIGSGLMGGTMTVTDSEAPTVAQANAFLNLLAANGNGGIPAANVSFGGHTEAITDTLVNIQILTGSAGWTANPSLHADFSLIVADTVAHLIDPANTAALSAVAGTTLSGNQTTTAANAESLFEIESTIAFSLGGQTIAIQDTAANILNAANAGGEALATSWQLSGNDTVAAADAETLLTSEKFSENGHTLTIADSSDNLLDGVLAGDIAGFSGAAQVQVQLAGAETLDAHTAAVLVALPGFTNTGDLSIQDSSDYLLNAANHTAEADATSVTLIGDETVSVATATALAAVPNFSLGSSHLLLASNDYANAAVLAAIGNFDTGFDANGHTLTMTQDALNLTPAEYIALQSDNIVLNGHALSALATGIVVTSGAGTVHISGNGVDGATLNIYASSGASLSQTAGVGASFTANASEGAIGNGVVVTETVGALSATSESAPIIALEQTVITSAVTGAGASFAGSGSVQVAVGEYLNVYTTANAPASPANPYLVYDATAHTLSLDIAGYSPLVLVTLGAATHPASLDASEIIVQHFT